jgi:lipopolysaccharide transport system permease protein
MNPHATQPTSLLALGKSLWRNRQLVSELTRREVVGRYKGSVMGLLWSFLNPVVMLTVYTFFFSVVFKARWNPAQAEPEGRGMFAVLLFAGLIAHGLFAEVLNRAPQLFLSNVNYVKKVVFPLEVLPVVLLGTALFHAGVSVLVLLAALGFVQGVPCTAAFLPLIFLPLLLFTLGFALVLSSLGVFLRDVGQTVGIFTTILLFLSPVFFPVDALPRDLQPWMLANPLTFIIEQVREVAIWGRAPDWLGLFTYTAVAVSVAWLGFYWFQKTRKGFADVL